MPVRTIVAGLVFVAGTAACAIWAWRATADLRSQLDYGGGGIGGVSGGLEILLLGAVVLIAPLVITRRISRKIPADKAPRVVRWTQLAVTLLLIGLMARGDFFTSLFAMLTFLPIQMLFVVAAVSLWIASASQQPRT